jgi:hypothetical protein
MLSETFLVGNRKNTVALTDRDERVDFVRSNRLPRCASNSAQDKPKSRVAVAGVKKRHKDR